MNFEFDPTKDIANIAKHGVSLEAAVDFDFSESVAWVFDDTRRDYGETRYVGISYIGDVLHVLVFTPRAGGIRVISLREANSREEKLYEQKS